MPEAGRDELVAYYFGETARIDIVPAERSREWMLKTTKSFANRCLPLLMANESGWWLRNRNAFTATWNGGAGATDTEIVFDSATAPGGGPKSSFGYGIISWTIACVFRTPPGVDLLVRGPANLPKDGASALEGLVETDWIEATFTMNWKLTRPGLEVRFDQGEPFAMVLPQGRVDLERYTPLLRPLSEEPELHRRVSAWNERRKTEKIRAFAAEHVPELGGPNWDGSYMRGEHGDGSQFAGHRVRRGLRAFVAPRE
jgi:hypothetical protein